MTKKRVFSFIHFLGQFSQWGFVIIGAILVVANGNDARSVIRVILIEFSVAATIKYVARWIFERYSDPINIEYAENGTVIGYKILACNSNQTVESPVYPYLWKNGWNKSDGSRFSSRSGFYAYRDFEMARRNRGTAYYFIAKLEMAGKVVVCEDGYRSEYARVVDVLSTGFAFRRDFEDSMNLLLVKRIRE